MVVQAGFISLMRTLLIIAAIFFGARLFVRYIIPFFLGRFLRKQQEKFYGQQAGTPYNRDDEGTVRVKTKGQSSRKKDDLGEYVDYEDIDESK